MHEADKLEEAKHFLARMRHAEAEQDEVGFRHDLSAFLSAGRSVLQYARAEADEKKSLAWYDRAVASDPCIAFLRDQRDDNIHERPVAPVTVTTITPGPRLGAEEYATVETEYFFLEWPETENAVALGERYLRALEDVVSDGRATGVLSADSPSRGTKGRRTKR